MKKTLLVLLCAGGAAAPLVAQPVLTANVFPQAGDVITYQPVAGAGVLPGPSGANVTWDFSGLIPTDPAYDAYYLEAAGTPHAATFPDANLAELVAGQLNDSVYSYFRASGVAWDYQGYGLYGVYLKFTDPELLLLAPTPYADPISDAFTRYSTLPDNSVQGSGARTLKYDAYGTLLIPGATYTDAMRVTSLRTGRDTTWLFAGYSVNNFIDTVYNWYVPNLPGPRFSIYTYGGTSTYYLGNLPPTTQPITQDKMVRYALGTTPTHEPTAAADWQIQFLSQLPATDHLAFQVRQAQANGQFAVQIHSSNGQLLYQGPINANTALEIPVGHWPAGAYFLTVRDGKIGQTKGWVKG